MGELLDIVNEHDQVVGQMDRDEVHEKGLICRIVYVCFYTPDNQLILQKRSLTKKNNPGRFTTTVSGHVSSGDTYISTAVKETFEEAGVIIDAEKLLDLGVSFASYTEGTYLSNCMRALYLYEFDGDIASLKIEEGEGVGFELIDLAHAIQIVDQHPEQYVPYLADILHEGILQDRIQTELSVRA